MKILVAIACYGTKNLKYLEILLSEYRRMAFQIDIVVLSNEPRDLGPKVEVLVGLPVRNPWSLPFAHKPLFAARRKDYDLFIYTEDDVLITEQNIRAFLQTTEVLPPAYLAGFMRYEVAPGGKKYYSTMHGHYHWEPDSVMRLKPFTFARYTNDHSGCFMLTRQQLAKALASGGFMLGFRKGRYGYPETAATDIYTQCGFKKVICISHLEDFCLPHLPNLYVGRLGVEKDMADREIERLKSLDAGDESLGPLFRTDTGLEDISWDKQYHEPPREDVLAMVPAGARTALSIGCGAGATEEKLVKRGVDVLGIPVDCVVAASAAARGIELLPPDLAAARQHLGQRRFDCILFIDSLHRFKQPVLVLDEFARLLEHDGMVIISAPNFNHVSVLRKRMNGKLKLPRSDSSGFFTAHGLHLTTFRRVRQWLAQSELGLTGWHLQVPGRFRGLDRVSLGFLRCLLAENLVAIARHRPARDTEPGKAGGHGRTPRARTDGIRFFSNHRLDAARNPQPQGRSSDCANATTVSFVEPGI